jgi:hypothetical protein
MDPDVKAEKTIGGMTVGPDRYPPGSRRRLSRLSVVVIGVAGGRDRPDRTHPLEWVVPSRRRRYDSGIGVALAASAPGATHPRTCGIADDVIRKAGGG